MCIDTRPRKSLQRKDKRSTKRKKQANNKRPHRCTESMVEIDAEFGEDEEGETVENIANKTGDNKIP